MALAALCTSELALADDAALSIETGSPDALCPELTSTRAAVSRRLGELIMPGGSSGYRARYTIAHAPVGTPRDFVRLELYGPEGDRLLSRDLPLEGESCSTMAEVIALVLDRYFRQLLAHEPEPTPPEEATPQPPAPEPSAAPVAPESAAASTPASDSPPVTPTDSAPSEPSSQRGPTTRPLGLVAVELAIRGAGEPALGARAMLELGPQIYVGTALHVGLLADSEDLAGGVGEVTSRDVTWRAYAAWGPQFGSLHTYIGPGFRFALARGSSSGLTGTDVGIRATWAAGLDAGAIWSMSDGWTLAASAALDFYVEKPGGRFVVEGREVLTPEPLQAWLGVAVGHAF
jgi:hypothetical protein